MSTNKSKPWLLASGSAVVVLFGAMLWLARPDAQSATAFSSGSSLIAVGTAHYDFGKISMAAGKVTHQFSIKNTSTEAITINKMYTSCMCTKALLVLAGRQFGPYGMPGHGFIPTINQVINPDEEATVEVVFDPAAHGPAGIGKISRTVSIENNAGRPLELRFTALVTP